LKKRLSRESVLIPPYASCQSQAPWLYHKKKIQNLFIVIVYLTLLAAW